MNNGMNRSKSGLSAEAFHCLSRSSFYKNDTVTGRVMTVAACRNISMELENTS